MSNKIESSKWEQASYVGFSIFTLCWYKIKFNLIKNNLINIIGLFFVYVDILLKYFIQLELLVFIVFWIKIFIYIFHLIFFYGFYLL